MSDEIETLDDLIAEIGKKDPETAEEIKDEPLEVSGSPDEPVEVEEPEADEPEIIGDSESVTIKSLAADLEIDPQLLFAMKVTVPGRGDLTLSELKDAAQDQHERVDAAKEKETQLAELKADLEQQQIKLGKQAEGIAPQELVKAYSDIARVEQEYSSIDWSKAEAMNPGEASLKRQKLNEAYQIAVYNRDQIEARMETTRNEIQAQRDSATDAQRSVALETLHNLVPEWRDEVVFNKDREHMVNALVDAGVDEADLRGLNSPTLINYLYRSTLRDTKIDKAKPINKPPKVLKASTIREAGIGRKKSDERLFKHACKTKDQRSKEEARRLVIAGRI